MFNFFPLLITDITQKQVLVLHNDFTDIYIKEPKDSIYLGLSNARFIKDKEHFYETCNSAKLNLNTIYNPRIEHKFTTYKNNLFFPIKPLKAIARLNLKFKKRIKNSILYTGMIPYENKSEVIFKDCKLTKYLKYAPLHKLRHYFLLSQYKFQNDFAINYPKLHNLSLIFKTRFNLKKLLAPFP